MSLQTPMQRRAGQVRDRWLHGIEAVVQRQQCVWRRNATTFASSASVNTEDRAVPDHWEGDLLCGAKNSHIATPVERSSRFVILVKVAGKDSDSVVSALISRVQNLPQSVMASLTWDRGTELAYHRKFTVATDVCVYFCGPKSPWQRGSNENTNGLLRQYLPNGTDLSVYTQSDLDRIALRLNTGPRKTLGFQTPADTFDRAVALTG